MGRSVEKWRIGNVMLITGTSSNGAGETSLEMEKKQGELAGINELSREGCCLCSLFCEGLGTSSALGRGCSSFLRSQ